MILMVKINHFHLAKYNSYSIYRAHECSYEFLVTWNHWSSSRCSLILHHFSLRKWFIHFLVAYLLQDYYLFHSFFKCVFLVKKSAIFDSNKCTCAKPWMDLNSLICFRNKNSNKISKCLLTNLHGIYWPLFMYAVIYCLLALIRCPANERCLPLKRETESHQNIFEIYYHNWHSTDESLR